MTAGSAPAQVTVRPLGIADVEAVDAVAHANVGFITARQPWAIDVALAARLTLKTDGAVCTRGKLGPLAPYLPSGAYL